MSKGWKIAISIILSVIFVGCIPFNVWYFYLLSKKDDHIVSYTFEIGKQTLSDGSSSKYFVEVEYNSNEEDNGREEFGIKFNYMLDENQTAFFSQGLQYVANADSDIYFANATSYILANESTNLFGWRTRDFNVVSRIMSHPDMCSRYNYMSADDYRTTVLSTNPISLDTMFKIQIGDSLYGMKFKGDVATGKTTEEGNIAFWTTVKSTYYKRYDVDYFAALLFNSIKALQNGTQRVLAFEFGDLFDYFEYNPETAKYDRAVDAAKLNTLTTDVKSYYSILLKKSATGIERASDSMFNMVEGNSGFSVGKTIPTDDYFVGRSVIDCTLDDFVKVKITNNDIALKLKDSFINELRPYNEKIRLNVLIDLDKLENENFLGLTKDNGLNQFVVQSCQTKQTIDGQVVYSEVAYE